MKNQALYSLRDKSKKLKCRLLQFLFSFSVIQLLFIVSVLTRPYLSKV